MHQKASDYGWLSIMGSKEKRGPSLGYVYDMIDWVTSVQEILYGLDIVCQNGILKVTRSGVLLLLNHGKYS